MSLSQPEIATVLEWLGPLGFVGPRLEKNRANQTFCWLGEDIGVELELDAREEGMFLLLVRLESGHLPDGYYVAHGMLCRVHIENAISDLRLDVDVKALERVRSLNRTRRRSPSHWIDMAHAYSDLLRSCIGQILSEGSRIFRSPKSSI